MRKLNLKRIITMGLITTSILAIAPVGASAEWRQNNTGWWYAEGNNYSRGWKNIGGSWYYFDNNGYMKIGWIQDNGSWYYLKADGTMGIGTINIDGQLSHFYGDGKWQGYVTNNPNITSTQLSNSNNQSTNANGTSQISEFTDIIAADMAYKKYKNEIELHLFDLGMESPEVQIENGKRFFYVSKWRDFARLYEGQLTLYGVCKVFEDGTIVDMTAEEYLQTQYAKEKGRSTTVWRGGKKKTAEEMQKEKEEERQNAQYFLRH